MGKASVSLNEHQLPGARVRQREKEDHGGPGISPRVATQQDTIDTPLSPKHGQLKGPSYIGKGWIQLNMVKVSPDNTLREYEGLHCGIRGVPVALGGERTGRWTGWKGVEPVSRKSSRIKKPIARESGARTEDSLSHSGI